MNCPACSRELTTKNIGKLSVDVCDGGCGGIWFDHYELQKVDEDAESAGEQLLDVRRDPDDLVDPEKRYTCPNCADFPVMLRHFWSVKRAVTMDECPECGGVFLDAGELGSIRHEFPTHEAKEAAADAYFKDVVDPLLEREHAKTMEQLASAQKFAKAFRFVCPSYYVPGKQAGAAF
jgi:Zn-finger nucleic acid-binding protein